MCSSREAAHAAAEILCKGYGVWVEKALNPLVHDDFVVLCDRLNRGILRLVRPHEKVTMDAILQDLDVDWGSLSDVSRAQVIETAKHRLLGLPALVISGLVTLLSERIGALVEASRRQVVDRYDLSVPREPGAEDIQAASSLVALQGLFVAEEYSRRAERLGAQIEEGAFAALAAGAGPVEVTAQVSEAVREGQRVRSDLYWAVVATVLLGYARSSVQIGAFSEAGVATYTFVSDLCATVSDICLYLNGRTFSVEKAAERLRQAEAAGDPNSFKLAHPWVSLGKREDGRDILFYRRGLERVTVAEIDSDGSFSAGMDTAQLEAAGLSIPPLHAHCHSSISIK